MRIYSTDVKRTALEKIFRPGANLSEISREMNIPRDTLYFWMRKTQNGVMSNRGRRSRLSLKEKQALVMKARGMNNEDLGLWLRENGFHEGNIDAWQREIEAALENLDDHPRREAEQRGRIKELEREIRRKDSALAEMSALIVLKKKLAKMFGEEESPT
jgi:DNA-binding transcriptional MerR regulator